MIFRGERLISKLWFGLWALTAVGASAETTEFLPPSERQRQNEAREREAVKPKIKKVPPAYSKYREHFDAICTELTADGRRDAFAAVLLAGAVRDSDCIACKPYFSAFYDSCKTKGKKAPGPSRAQPSASATPYMPQQREPSVELISALNEFFQTLAADQKNIVEHYLAVKKLLAILQKADGWTPAATEYFGVVAHVIAAPFAAHKREIERTHREETVKERANLPPLNLDEFFGD